MTLAPTYEQWQPWTGASALLGLHDGIAVGQKVELTALCTLPVTAETDAKHPFKLQLHPTHVGAVGWEQKR